MKKHTDKAKNIRVLFYQWEIIPQEPKIIARIGF